MAHASQGDAVPGITVQPHAWETAVWRYVGEPPGTGIDTSKRVCKVTRVYKMWNSDGAGPCARDLTTRGTDR